MEPKIPVITILITDKPIIPSSTCEADIPMGVVKDFGKSECMKSSDKPSDFPKIKTETKADNEPIMEPEKMASLWRTISSLCSYKGRAKTTVKGPKKR